MPAVSATETTTSGQNFTIPNNRSQQFYAVRSGKPPAKREEDYLNFPMMEPTSLLPSFITSESLIFPSR